MQRAPTINETNTAIEKQARNMDRAFLREEIHITNKHLKIFILPSNQIVTH